MGVITGYKYRFSALGFRDNPKPYIVNPCRFRVEDFQLYNRSPKVGNPIASILQSNV